MQDIEPVARQCVICGVQLKPPTAPFGSLFERATCGTECCRKLKAKRQKAYDRPQRTRGTTQRD